MHLNHPETIPHPNRSVEKLSSIKLVPGAKKVGDHCDRRSGRRRARKNCCVCILVEKPVSRRGWKLC